MISMTCAPNARRLSLLLHGAIAVYESSAPENLALLDTPDQQELLEAFDLLGSALHWMQQEMKSP